MIRRCCTRVWVGLAVTFVVTACLTPSRPASEAAGNSRVSSRDHLTVPGGGGTVEAVTVAGVCNPSQTMVSLTYDDSLPTQLSTVAPALRAHHLRATFFITDVRSNPAPWAALKADGHELGAHTLNHPCTKTMAWVNPGKASEDYDLDRMAKELDANITELRQLGQQAPFSFAYPCGTQWIGAAQTSYVSLVKERFAGARGVTSGVVTRLLDAYDVPAAFRSGSGAELVRLVESAQAEKGWVVFGFHGVGGDSNSIAADAHEVLLTYLEQHSDAVQVLPFGEALQCKSAK